MDISATLQSAYARFNARDLAGADNLCRTVLAVNPQQPDALHLAGIIRLYGGDAPAALELLSRAATLAPGNPAAVENLGLAQLATGNPAAAQQSFERAIAAGATHPLVHMRLGMALGQQGKRAAGLAAMAQAAELAPNDPTVQLNYGGVLAETGQHAEAERAFRRVLELQPGHVDAWCNLGTLYRLAGRPADALEPLMQAVQRAPGYADAWNNLALTYQALSRHGEALDAYRRALKADAQNLFAACGVGDVLLAQGDLEGALAAYERARVAHAAAPDPWICIGNLKAGAGDIEGAINAFRSAIAVAPRGAEAYRNIARLNVQRAQFDAAVTVLEQGIKAGAPAGLLYLETGATLKEARVLDRAIGAYQQALAADPGLADAHFQLAEAYMVTAQLPDALASYERALSINPRHRSALAGAAHVRQHLCAWDGLEALWSRLREPGATDALPVGPFMTLSWPASAAEQLQYASSWAKQYLAGARTLAARKPYKYTKRAAGRLRIGYVSAAFRRHALAHLTAALFEEHDRSRYEIHAYSCAPDDGSAAAARIRQACEHFHDVAAVSYADTADCIHADGIDVLIDLDGWTIGSRLRTFALRPAPVQVSWLGYPGTLGADCMDYVFADAVIIPPGAESDYMEQVVRLSGCYQVNDPRREVGQLADRAAFGLPATGFVFCCFNQAYKITPAIFAAWMRVLSACPGSVLWLAEANTWAAENLRAAAQRAGVDPARLIFAPRRPLPDYLAQYRCADLVLDTEPYGSHTTGGDALWMGCPVLALEGSTFASRVSTSLVTAAGLPEMSVRSLQDYETLAIELARDPGRIASMRNWLAAVRDTAGGPFDAAAFARKLEAACEDVYRRWADRVE